LRNVLFLYQATQTYTNTVFEHLDSFARHSRHRYFFCHQDLATAFDLELSRFDAVVIHFSIRLPYDQIAPSTAAALARFIGLKVLFIQDEYDHTRRAWHWIGELGIQLVFTVVPPAGMQRIYPPDVFPRTRFVNNLTGYVPDELVLKQGVPAPSRRAILIGYRGRPLPIRYGRLGIEKVNIGRMVKSYCDGEELITDIAWSEESRIYGPNWYRFMTSCRAMLGSESGSNVFDWDGLLSQRIAEFQRLNPRASDLEAYEQLVQSQEIDGIMNQVSPRIFEAVAAKTVLVLFEGAYSGVVTEGEHFIAVKKDGSNLAKVIQLLQDDAYVDAMANRAYRDVIGSGRYSYSSFVLSVDDEIDASVEALSRRIFNRRSDSSQEDFAASPATPSSEGAPPAMAIPTPDVALHVSAGDDAPLHLTTRPIRARPPRPSPNSMVTTIAGAVGARDLSWRVAVYCWWRLPGPTRNWLRPRLKSLLGRS